MLLRARGIEAGLRFVGMEMKYMALKFLKWLYYCFLKRLSTIENMETNDNAELHNESSTRFSDSQILGQ